LVGPAQNLPRVSQGGDAAIRSSEERLLAHVRTANLDRNEATCGIRDDACGLEGDAVAKPPPAVGGPRSVEGDDIHSRRLTRLTAYRRSTVLL
jgi:hypothetical protein